MKKLLFLMLISGLMFQPAFAQTIHVKAVENFNTEFPTETLSVIIVDPLIADDDTIIFKNGDVVEGTVEVTEPKRLKRNATFSFSPKSIKDETGVVTKLDKEYPAKFTTKLNKADVAKSAALAVGNHFVDGLSAGVAVVEGAIKNQEGNRFKSSAKSLYESTPLSYVEHGKQIYLKKDDIFLLNFKVPKAEELPNYEYTQLDDNVSE